MRTSSDLDPFADVELVDVSKSFGGTDAVRNVFLTINKGEFFSLLGPSGCGKTTLLRMISGFEIPTSGQLILRGQIINNVPPHRRATNMVFQQLALFPHISVFENVAFSLRRKRVPQREIDGRVKESLASVSLEKFEDRFPNQLSGGQQQRVAIARALINEPAVLLLDEPLGALDLKLRIQMQSELKALQARLGTTFIYVTHDQVEAFAMSDRIALMNEGRIEQIGTPREIYEHPRNRFVATFVGDTNFLDGRVVEHNGPDLVIDAEGLMIHALADRQDIGDEILISIRPEHIRMGGFAETTTDHIQATIRTVSFQGTLIRFALATTTGNVIVADVLNENEAAALKPGDQVPIGWSPDHVVVLPQ